MGKSNVEKFEVLSIPRSKINNAPYNPRTISDENRKRLKAGLKKFGLVETLVWNKRTGNLVSGHQRLSIIDELEKKDNYNITVSAIDVSEADEMALNVQLNNSAMMGEFDFDLLEDMVSDGANAEDFGFSDSDLDLIFGDSEYAKRFEDTPEAERAKGVLKDIKKDRAEFMEEKKTENSAGFYFTVVCADLEQKEKLYKKMGIPFTEEFISADSLKRLCD